MGQSALTTWPGTKRTTAWPRTAWCCSRAASSPHRPPVLDHPQRPAGRATGIAAVLRSPEPLQQLGVRHETGAMRLRLPAMCSVHVPHDCRWLVTRRVCKPIPLSLQERRPRRSLRPLGRRRAPGHVVLPIAGGSKASTCWRQRQSGGLRVSDAKRLTALGAATAKQLRGTFKETYLHCRTIYDHVVDSAIAGLWVLLPGGATSASGSGCAYEPLPSWRVARFSVTRWPPRRFENHRLPTVRKCFRHRPLGQNH